MSNSASYTLCACKKWDDLRKLETWMKDRKNFPYDFQWELLTVEDEENDIYIHALTVQAEEINRSFSGADGYLMEITEKFPEVEIPITSHEVSDFIGCKYSDEDGKGWLSNKEDGFQKLKDYSGKLDLIELRKHEADTTKKIVEITEFNIWMESKDNGKTATVHFETGKTRTAHFDETDNLIKVSKGEEEMEQGTYISEPIPLIEAEIKLRELERKKDEEGFH